MSQKESRNSEPSSSSVDKHSIPHHFKFDQVIRTSQAPWEKVEDEEDPFAKLHRTFWGKRVEKDARKWRKKNEHLFPQESDSLTRSGDAPVVVHPKPVGEDIEHEFFEGDDVVDGCHVMDINEEQIQPRPFWVRAEYVRLYAFVMDRYKQAVHKSIRSGFVITGQPGIGERP